MQKCQKYGSPGSRFSRYLAPILLLGRGYIYKQLIIWCYFADQEVSKHTQMGSSYVDISSQHIG